MKIFKLEIFCQTQKLQLLLKYQILKTTNIQDWNVCILKEE